MLYPAQFAPLSDDEMIYTTGGDSNTQSLVTFTSLTLSVVNTIYVVSIKRKLKPQYPDDSNIALTLRAFNAYMSTPYGLMMELASIGLLIGGLFL